MSNVKACNRCDFVGEETDFYSKGGEERRPECKGCTKKASAAYRAPRRAQLAEKSRRLRIEHPEIVRGYEAKRDLSKRKKQWAAGYQRYRGRRLAQAKAYYGRSREAVLHYSKARYAANRSEFRKQRKAYQLAHPENVQAWEQKKRAKRAAAPGHASADQIAARVAYYGSRCAYCGGPYEHLDHVIPLSRGGSNWPANLRPACAKCNMTKHARKLSEWRP